MSLIRRLFCALLALLLLSSGARAQDTGDLIRLHVLAQSDAPEAQALKLEIRDACLDAARICLAGAGDADEAYMRLNDHLEDFAAACTRRARELGYAGSITAETGTFDFPDRIYGSVRVPAGQYRALRITIGGGKGHNWWCVLYPSLCFLDESAADDPAGILAWLKRRLGGV